MKRLILLVIVILVIGIAVVVGGTIRNYCLEGKYGHLDRVSIQ